MASSSAEVKGAVERVAVGIKDTRLGVVLGKIIEQIIDPSSHGDHVSVLTDSVILHHVDGDDVLEFDGHSRIAAVGGTGAKAKIGG
eukprot:236286-Rhodomonas_salina.1